MTEKQKRFADKYLISANATEAYKAAYPHIKSDNVAKSAGARLLTFVDVKSYIDERFEEMKSERIADPNEVMECLTSFARGETETEVIVIESKGGGISEARRMTKKPDGKERLKAAELLAKRYGLLTDKVNVESAQVIFRGESNLED